jgi:hypothetical protein
MVTRSAGAQPVKDRRTPAVRRSRSTNVCLIGCCTPETPESEPAGEPAGSGSGYGVVVDSVNVSVFE